MLKGIVTGDWHLDRFNRLDDMAKCVDFAIDEAIRRKVDVFVHTGDLYRTWHPAPIEMAVFHRITRLARAGIKTYVVIGNHDWPESEEYKRTHCATELKSLDSGIRVMDAPEVVGVSSGAGPAGLPAVDFLFMPHVPKAELQRSGLTYDQWYKATLDGMVKSSFVNARVLFSHAYVREAAVGPHDLVVENDRQITLATLQHPGLAAVFLGDIHKAQRLSLEPVVIYPGSLDRVDFGEADDPKGITYFEVGGSGAKPTILTEFIPTPARRFVHIVADVTGTDRDLQAAAEDEVRKADVADAVVKITVRCDAGRKDQINEDALRSIVAERGAARLRSLNFDVGAVRVARAPEIGENMSAAGALPLWVAMQKYPSKGTEDAVLARGRKLIGVEG